MVGVIILLKEIEMKWLRNLYTAYLRNERQADFDRGYNYGAGCLLRDGDAALIRLETIISGMIVTENHTAFDKGVVAAITRYKELTANN